MRSLENNVTSLLAEMASRTPERLALVCGEEAINFAGLRDRVRQCAQLLLDGGLRAGDRVIIMVPMSIDLYVTLLGVIHTGAVAVFVDPWIGMRQIAAFAGFAEPAGFIGIPKSHLLRGLSCRLWRLRVTVSTGAVFCRMPAKISLKQLDDLSCDLPPAPVAPADAALITFTSGSSGAPKGANRTHGFLMAQHKALSRELPLQDDDIDMPMFPVFALRNLASGITSVIPEMDFRKVAEVDAAAIQRQIDRHRVTHITASPPFIDRLAEYRQAHDPVCGIRRIITGGAPVTVDQIKNWQQAFPAAGIDIVYGSTEAEPVAHISVKERLAVPAGPGYCCGRPTSLLATRIVAIRKGTIEPEELASLTLPPGQVGELLVAGDHVCRDYFRNPAAVAENKIIEADGTCWHRMGDTGYFDDEGHFYLTGRVHSTILRKGEVLHAQLVEAEVAGKLPNARRIAALECDGQLVVVVETTDKRGAEVDIDADEIIFTDKPLPLDPRHNAKIDYGALRGQLPKLRKRNVARARIM